MKSTNIRKNHSKKEITTNYPKDGHKSFCKRCLLHNGVCPKTGHAAVTSKDCDL